MNIPANSNTLDSELDYANVDMRKTLEPFGLEMWPGATNGRDLDHPTETPIASLLCSFITFLKKTEASIWIVPTLPKSIRMLMKRLRPNMLGSTAFQARLTMKPGSIPYSIGWHLKARMPTSYRLGHLDRLRKKGKVKSYQELQTWNDNHIRKK